MGFLAIRMAVKNTWVREPVSNKDLEVVDCEDENVADPAHLRWFVRIEAFDGSCASREVVFEGDRTGDMSLFPFLSQEGDGEFGTLHDLASCVDMDFVHEKESLNGFVNMRIISVSLKFRIPRS